MRSYREIIKRLFYFSPLLVLFLFTWCEEEKPVAREYPRLKDIEVTNISDSGATFSADLYSMGTEVPTEYGFLWGTNSLLDYNYSNKVIIGKPDKPGKFSANITTGLKKDIEYAVKPFVKTDERMVYGPSTEFKSLGSNAPAIYGFYPDSAGWGDTVKISGRNFALLTGTNEVKLNQVRCLSVKSTDTTLYFTVDYSVTSLKNVISVVLAGNVNTFIKDTFMLIPPRIIDFQPRQAYWGDTIKITGKYLRYYNYKPDNLTKLGSFTCPLAGYPSDSLIKIKVPFDVNVTLSNLSVFINGYMVNAPARFELLPPYFSFSPATASWGNTIALNGRFNTIASRNNVYFNSTLASISSVTATRMLVKVPYPLTSLKSAVKYIVAPFNVVSSDSFAISPPVINSFLPKNGPSGTIVTIKGKCFSSVAAFGVKFGSVSANVTSINDSVIVTKVPLGVTGPVKITVTASSLSGTSIEDFQIVIPQITGVSPLTGTFDDEITITGENFVPLGGNTSVSFNGVAATIARISESEIVVKVPVAIDSIPRSLVVVTGSTTLTSAEKFTLLPPEITSIFPSALVPGQDITISGHNFNPDISQVTVLWNNYPLAVKSSSSDQVIATWPAGLIRGISNLIFKTGGYTRSSTEFFESKSKWGKIQFPSAISWNSEPMLNYTGIFFAVKGKGYMMDYNDTKSISFDPDTKEFTQLVPHSHFGGYTGAVSIVRNDTLFLISSPGFQKYDSDLNLWVPIGSAPSSSRNGAGFSLNGRLYFGLPYNVATSTLNKSFWEYDFATKSWKVKSNFPGYSSRYAVAYFSIGNKGYVLFTDNIFCRYDPDTDTWTKLQSYPGPGTDRFGRVSFVINDLAYVGCGRFTAGGGQSYDDFWVYDPVANSWAQSTYMPGGGRYNSISFVLNNKAYIGLGFVGTTKLLDFYEFDPNYPLK